jgi:hypothetical protein
MWVVVILGAATTLWTLLGISRTAGVYWAQTDVVLIAPASAALPNTLPDRSDDLVALAGVLVRLVNDGQVDIATASPDVTIVGEGVRDGWSVTLPNDGGQWTYNFERPVLDVQVVAATPDRAVSRMSELLARIERSLMAMQRDAGVGEANIVQMAMSPSPANVSYVGGSHLRAMAGAGILGTVLTVSAAVLIDRRVLGFDRPRRVARATVRKPPAY